MWLASAAVVLTVIGAVVTGGGMVAGRRSDDRATSLFVVGVGVFSLGTVLLALVLLTN